MSCYRLTTIVIVIINKSYLWYYVPVHLTSVVDSVDELVDELLYCTVVPLVFLQNCYREAVFEQQCHVPICINRQIVLNLLNLRVSKYTCSSVLPTGLSARTWHLAVVSHCYIYIYIFFFFFKDTKH